MSRRLKWVGFVFSGNAGQIPVPHRIRDGRSVRLPKLIGKLRAATALSLAADEPNLNEVTGLEAGGAKGQSDGKEAIFGTNGLLFRAARYPNNPSENSGAIH